MTLSRAAVDAVILLALFSAVLYCMHRALLWARNRKKRAYVIGAALAPFVALGNVADPDFRIVHEAKQHKKREDGDAGDPPRHKDDEVRGSVEPATAADHAKILELLAEARLPIEDIEPTAPITFWAVRDDPGALVGTIGLERHGSVGLLRSLAVAPRERQHGLGRALVRAVERHADAVGIEQLVLLTETAEKFFRRLGYVVIPRDRAPPAVASSAEFRTLCAATAVCMTKLLSASHQ